MLQTLHTLPIEEQILSIQKSPSKHNRLILQAPLGHRKTTAVSLLIHLHSLPHAIRYRSCMIWSDFGIVRTPMSKKELKGSYTKYYRPDNSS
nr:hypothetical protein [Sulfuricurvum sp.]